MLRPVLVVIFLAAMSNSRSDSVTQFVRVCVRVFVPKEFFQTLRVSMVLKESKAFFKDVSKKFQGCFKED